MTVNDSILNLRRRIDSREAVVGVLGLGYVGLPLCIYAERSGFTVVGFDVDGDRVAQLERGESYLSDLGEAELGTALENGRFSAVSDEKGLDGADIFVICVPTPLTPNQVPDVSFLHAATETVSRRLRPGCMVIVESTTYPGCTRDDILPILEQSGLRPDVDFLLAFSPERVNPGNGMEQTRSTPKLVGGVTPASLDAASAFYRCCFTEVVELSSAEVAEMAKLLENVYRSVNIALVNELAVICNSMGISVWEVIDAAATKPFGFTPFYPGPGLGGHCIPIDPFYLSWKARELGLATEFIELAGKVNTRMPAYVVDRVTQMLNDASRSIRGSAVMIIGAAYKADVADLRESPALKVAQLLIEKGARITYHDPHVGSFMIGEAVLYSIPLTKDSLSDADCVVILTPHSAVDWELVYRNARLVLDARNVIPHDGRKSFSI
ncbi:MAG: nucleotide sugar dehydrogenase [Gaiellales bacterium]|nr:MAG: nucleotide sugar dehydrogenase [Gaiellales bacterium]